MRFHEFGYRLRVRKAVGLFRYRYRYKQCLALVPCWGYLGGVCVYLLACVRVCTRACVWCVCVHANVRTCLCLLPPPCRAVVCLTQAHAQLTGKHTQCTSQARHQ